MKRKDTVKRNDTVKREDTVQRQQLSFMSVPVVRAIVIAAAVLMSRPALAQNLIANLPAEDGAWVRLEGDHIEKKSRSAGGEGDLELPWRSELTIKSVGKEEAEVNGAKVACRWVEFKSEFKAVQSNAKEGAIQPDPFGTRIYKVLVPEQAVTINAKDDKGLPITFIPVVKGYRKIASRDPQPVTEKVLVVYPMVSLLTQYPNWAAGESVNVDAPNGALAATEWKGARVLTSSTLRSSNEGQLFVSEQVPFGAARVKVKVQRFEKDATAAEDAFKLAAEINSDLIAVETGTDAQSDLPDLK